MSREPLTAGSVTIDFSRGEVRTDDADGQQTFSLTSPEGFAAASRAWLRAGWDAKYVYSFTWMGRPVIQLPDDLLRLQEVIYRVRPAVVIETGVAHGGSLVFHASLLKAMSLDGVVIGIDIEIREHNRRAIEAHELYPMIRLIESSSLAPQAVQAALDHAGDRSPVMVILDSNHARDHVAAELELYAPLVTPGSYLIVADGIMHQLQGAPRSGDDWGSNNPLAAVDHFLESHPEFEREPPAPPFNEGSARLSPTYFPGGWLRRVR